MGTYNNITTIGEYNAVTGAAVNASLVQGDLGVVGGIAVVATPEPSTLVLGSLAFCPWWLMAPQRD